VLGERRAFTSNPSSEVSRSKKDNGWGVLLSVGNEWSLLIFLLRPINLILDVMLRNEILLCYESPYGVDPSQFTVNNLADSQIDLCNGNQQKECILDIVYEPEALSIELKLKPGEVFDVFLVWIVDVES